MTEDQVIRTALTGASAPIVALLIQKAKAHLSTARDKEGRGLVERLGYPIDVCELMPQVIDEAISPRRKNFRDLKVI